MQLLDFRNRQIVKRGYEYTKTRFHFADKSKFYVLSKICCFLLPGITKLQSYLEKRYNERKVMVPSQFAFMFRSFQHALKTNIVS